MPSSKVTRKQVLKQQNIERGHVTRCGLWDTTEQYMLMKLFLTPGRKKNKPYTPHREDNKTQNTSDPRWVSNPSFGYIARKLFRQEDAVRSKIDAAWRGAILLAPYPENRTKCDWTWNENHFICKCRNLNPGITRIRRLTWNEIGSMIGRLASSVEKQWHRLHAEARHSTSLSDIIKVDATAKHENNLNAGSANESSSQTQYDIIVLECYKLIVGMNRVRDAVASGKRKIALSKLDRCIHRAKTVTELFRKFRETE